MFSLEAAVTFPIVQNIAQIIVHAGIQIYGSLSPPLLKGT